MGQELSCTSRGGKPFDLEDAIDQVVDGVEETAEALEQAVDDFTRAQPAKVSSALSDKEQSAALALFWQLVREQGGHVAGATAIVYEDAAMVFLLQRMQLVDGDEPRASEAAEAPGAAAAFGVRKLAGEPPS